MTVVSGGSRVPEVAQAIWNQLPVTSTGSVNVRVSPASSATLPAPSAGTVDSTAGAASVVKANTKFAAIVSGGSLASWSVTWAANTVVVHVSPAAKSAFGSAV